MSSEERPVGGLDHVGVVVSDLDAAKHLFVDVLGFEIASETFLEDLGLKITFVQTGSTKIELIEPSAEPERSERLGDGAARLEHLAFAVDEIGAAAAAVGGGEVTLVGGISPDAPVGEVLELATGKNMFSAPASSLDILIQLFEPKSHG